MRLAGKAMVIDAKHLAKRCHREGGILQPNNFSLLLSIIVDRPTLKLLSSFLFSLSSFFTYYNKGELYDKLFSHYNVSDSMKIISLPMLCLIVQKVY